MKCYLRTQLSVNDRIPVISEHQNEGDAVMNMVRHVRTLKRNGYSISTIRCTVYLEDENRTVAAEFAHGWFYPRGQGTGYPLFLKQEDAA